MARIRTIKPKFLDDSKIGKLSRDARLLYIALWFGCNESNISNSNYEFCKDKYNLYRYSKKKHQRILSELINHDFINDIGNELVIVNPHDVLGIRRSDRNDIYDWIEWKIISNKVFKRDHYTCTYCGRKNVKMEIDHIIPVSKGGSDDLSNLTTSCRRCNAQKKDKTLEEFLKWKSEHEK